MRNLRWAKTEPSMHFRKANTDPPMHFRKANTKNLLPILLQTLFTISLPSNSKIIPLYSLCFVHIFLFCNKVARLQFPANETCRKRLALLNVCTRQSPWAAPWDFPRASASRNPYILILCHILDDQTSTVAVLISPYLPCHNLISCAPKVPPPNLAPYILAWPTIIP